MKPHAGLYKPGHPGGPGRPKGPIIDPQLKELMGKALDKFVGCLLTLTRKDFQDVYKDENSIAFDYWCAGLVLHGGKSGDGRNLAFILDRVLGKVPIEARVDATVNNQVANPEILIEKLKELEEIEEFHSSREINESKDQGMA